MNLISNKKKNTVDRDKKTGGIIQSMTPSHSIKEKAERKKRGD